MEYDIDVYSYDFSRGLRVEYEIETDLSVS